MKATLTLKIKLETTEQAAQSLSETQQAYASALNRTSDVAFAQKVFNSVALPHITYRDMRELTNFPANLVCCGPLRCGRSLQARSDHPPPMERHPGDAIRRPHADSKDLAGIRHADDGCGPQPGSP